MIQILLQMQVKVYLNAVLTHLGDKTAYLFL